MWDCIQNKSFHLLQEGVPLELFGFLFVVVTDVETAKDITYACLGFALERKPLELSIPLKYKYWLLSLILRFSSHDR